MTERPALPVNERELRACMERAALDAGRAVMGVFSEPPVHELKDDASPVTVADRRAEIIICSALEQSYPHFPIVAEERAAVGILPGDLGEGFFLVDPLDGTKEFINRRTDFTINIALVVAGYPACGVVYAPALHTLYYGGPSGAFRAMVAANLETFAGPPARIATSISRERIVAVASRSHLTAETGRFLFENGINECINIGSSLKFCLLAEGKAHVYPRLGRTMQWDTAAGDAVLRAAGGNIKGTGGQPWVYGLRDCGEDRFANGSFLASAGEI